MFKNKKRQILMGISSLGCFAQFPVAQGSIWPDSEYKASVNLQLSSIESELAPSIGASWLRETISGWAFGVFANGLAMGTKGLSETSSHASLRIMEYGLQIEAPLFSSFFAGLSLGNASASYEQLAEIQLNPAEPKKETVSIEGTLFGFLFDYRYQWSGEEQLTAGFGLKIFSMEDSKDSKEVSRGESAKLSQPYVQIGWRQTIL